MDKWIPGICIVLSAVLASTAYFLWSSNISIASDTITQNKPEEEKKPEFQEKEKYKILIVPGHDKEDYGAKFQGFKEEEINLDLGKRLFGLFERDNTFEAYITRDDLGYTREFQKYFSEQKTNIKNFILANKKQTKEKFYSGEFEPVRVVEHNIADNDVVFKLYGINKWANENDIDLIIHIHFNDYPRSSMSVAGKYNGFSIYTPSENLTGHLESNKIAKQIRENLYKYFKESNLPVEKDIIIENSDLIAIGSNNTLKKAAPILIEYGYIYEPLFFDSKKRVESLNKAAYQTYQAIKSEISL